MISFFVAMRGRLFMSVLPRHIAIIPDGNNRWANKMGQSAAEAYTVGARAIFQIVHRANDLEIPYLTAYLMSLENLQKRSRLWRKTFFSFIQKTLDTYKNDELVQRVRLKIIGQVNLLPQRLQESLQKLIEATKNNCGITFTLAVAYTGQDEIVRAMHRFHSDILSKNPEAKVADLPNLSSEQFQHYLDTEDMPNPDLLIRTSGEQRLSGFLLWQMAYTEFLFVSKLWPDFSVSDFDQAIVEFQKRRRNFGKDRR